MLLNETGNKQQRHQCYLRSLKKLMSNPVMLVQYFVFQGTTIISIYTLIGPMRNLFPLSDELTLAFFPFCCREKSSDYSSTLKRILQNLEQSDSDIISWKLASH
jgi:hypothetical protein